MGRHQKPTSSLTRSHDAVGDPGERSRDTYASVTPFPLPELEELDNGPSWAALLLAFGLALILCVIIAVEVSA